jgi:hypothetical protein
MYKLTLCTEDRPNGLLFEGVKTFRREDDFFIMVLNNKTIWLRMNLIMAIEVESVNETQGS